MALTNAERQAAFRARQKLLSRRQQFSALVSEDEAFYLRRVLEAMRETGGIPAALRDPASGRYRHLDV